MNDYRRPRDTRRIGARILDTAEGVLVALRRCRVDQAFVELMHTAKRHGVNPVSLADALVAIAEAQPGKDLDDAAMAVALSTWGRLFGHNAHDRAGVEDLDELPATDG
ncbi:ANTAR domain-containing protein [Mycobacterium celatum]|uniref:ANTAR domain-containing protein n=1 Tax=Mycobacterium celatum TaxID=28045 RepID=A0A1X1RPJ6_MYCCE|nr:ANTAR domain-containing protein [Mycobacterium celatum]ORV10929.1 hypothetical protein AWB95_14020 [Mycobacterium celatum]PIB79536.1 ANTAR domain-containing protein [Mycobacterium celatum]